VHNYTHEVEIRTHVCSKSQCFSSYMYIHTQNGTFHEGVIVLTLGYNDDGQHHLRFLEAETEHHLEKKKSTFK
jgi:hypothetical protein